MAKESSLKLIQRIAKVMTSGPGWDKTLSKLKIVSAGDGKCKAEMLVGPDDQNKHGTLHGGMTATLVDVVSTYAVMTQGEGSAGVSVDMHITYMKSARDGEEIVIDASTMKAGKRLAFLEVDISNKANGDLIAKGLHTKFIG